MGTGFQLPQRVNNSHRAGSPQICGIFTTTITPIVGLLTVRNTVHNNDDVYVYLLKIREKS